jgi:hypothetical protein
LLAVAVANKYKWYSIYYCNEKSVGRKSNPHAFS